MSRASTALTDTLFREKYLNKLMGKKDIEDSLDRLDGFDSSVGIGGLAAPAPRTPLEKDLK